MAAPGSSPIEQGEERPRAGTEGAPSTHLQMLGEEVGSPGEGGPRCAAPVDVPRPPVTNNHRAFVWVDAESDDEEEGEEEVVKAPDTAPESGQEQHILDAVVELKGAASGAHGVGNCLLSMTVPPTAVPLAHAP
mmetsp:Transcript_34219/g.68135  ORF Transcript_34219/g.68135 Transcript_34219/m.68135 type:complete len:134 (+) Transcript_34219:1384-1785(+)